MSEEKICLCAGNHRIFTQEMWKRTEESKGDNWRRGDSVWFIDGTKYIFCHYPDAMRGFHGVAVEFFGPPLKDSRFYENAELARRP